MTNEYVTKTGRVLTDADIQALADEAERGYEFEFQLWRQDEHGNRFLVDTYPTRVEADRWQRTYEERGHKQTYDVRAVGRPITPSDAPTRRSSDTAT